MNKLALLGGALMALAASPAFGQAGGVPAPAAPGASGAGAAANRLEAPDRDAGANAQQMMDRQGRLSADFAKTAKRATAYRTQLEQFSAQSADRRTEAYALRDAARGGQAVGLSAKVIRDALLQDMEDWRKAFKIDRAVYEGLRDEIIVEESALTPTQWADRRAQWFEVRDAWIAQEVAQANAQGADAGAGG